jgi:hypothetical protein
MSFDLPYAFTFGSPSLSKALFLSSRWIDAATVAASSEMSSLPAVNVQSFRPDEVWRATGCTAEYLTFDFGSAVAANALVLLGHNLTGAATLRLRLGTSAGNAAAAPAVDTGALSAWPITGKPSDPDWPYYFSLLTWPNPTGYRYGRLDIADAANPAGYVQASRLYVGPSFVPAANVDMNIGLGLVSPGQVSRSPFGATFADDRGPAARSMAIPMSSIDESEMADTLFELQRYCGVARDFAFCLDPAATTRFHKYSMQALFASMSPFQAQPFWNGAEQLFQTTLTLNEVL